MATEEKSYRMLRLFDSVKGRSHPCPVTRVTQEEIQNRNIVYHWKEQIEILRFQHFLQPLESNRRRL